MVEEHLGDRRDRSEVEVRSKWGLWIKIHWINALALKNGHAELQRRRNNHRMAWIELRRTRQCVDEWRLASLQFSKLEILI